MKVFHLQGEAKFRPGRLQAKPLPDQTAQFLYIDTSHVPRERFSDLLIGVR